MNYQIALKELEKLDEDRRIAVMGIYAGKCRQKRWHDTNVKTGRFKKGYLFLLYTLKKLKWKLKMRGLGPFVINELSPSGAVHLETLDGEQMTDFINGIHIRQYLEPLTQEMMDRMHDANKRRVQAEVLKAEAKAKADRRARAIKAQK